MQGPLVITGTGGSGTRVVAEIAKRADWHLGTKLNKWNDNVRIANVENHPVGTRFLADGGPTPAQLQHYLQVIDLERYPHDRWGWKHSQTMYFMRWVYEAYPDTLRVIHVLRDGRDMAYSKNVFEHWFGPLFLSESERALAPEPVRNAKLWTRSNIALTEFCEKHIPDRYYRVKLEHLCEHPPGEVGKLFGWLGGHIDCLDAAVNIIDPPDTLGRWKEREPVERQSVTQACEDGLEEYGYDCS